MGSDAKEELLRQIRRMRRRIDPDLLARAEEAAKAAQAPRPPDDTVPFDKVSARESVMLFLQSRSDGGRFAAKLMEEMKKPEAASKAYDGADKPRPTVITRRI